MMTTAEFLMMIANLPYVRAMVSSACVTCYFDECYDESHDLTDEEQEQFDAVYDLLICRGLRLVDARVYVVDRADGSDSWDD